MANADTLTTVDRIAMLVGGGLIIVATVVMDFFETVIGSPHSMPETNEAGEVVAHTTFSPFIRANLIAAGLAILGLYAIYVVATRRPD